MDNPLVSIVILTWNSEDFLANCINSVLKQTYSNIELIVMDNNSHDNTIQIMKNSYPQIKRIENGENLGFAKAHNKGIRMSNGEYYMPLNPDVVLTECFVEEMVKGLHGHTNIGSASGKVYFLDEHGKPTKKIYTTGHLLTKNRKPHNRGYKKEDMGQHEESDKIFGVNGACPLFKKTMLEDVAMNDEYFDETFFLYGDDYDLGWRSQLFGWKAIFIPKAIAYHHSQGSGGLKVPYIQMQYARNRYIEIYKNDFITHFMQDFPFILCYEILWQGYIFLSNPSRSVSHAKAVIDFLRHLPETHRKRQAIHARRNVLPSYMRQFIRKMVLK